MASRAATMDAHRLEPKTAIIASHRPKPEPATLDAHRLEPEKGGHRRT
jgi:hypothetical protein